MKIITDQYLNHTSEGSFLSIESKQTLIVGNDKGENPVTISLDLGTDNISALFDHEPPTPAEIETAINIIEDELMLAVPVLSTKTELVSKDSFLQTVVDLAGNTTSDTTLSRNSMEAFFSRFAVISMGRNPHTDIIPIDALFSAKLLILREIMHHLKFEHIRILQSN